MEQTCQSQCKSDKSSKQCDNKRLYKVNVPLLISNVTQQLLSETWSTSLKNKGVKQTDYAHNALLTETSHGSIISDHASQKIWLEGCCRQITEFVRPTEPESVSFPEKAFAEYHFESQPNTSFLHLSIAKDSSQKCWERVIKVAASSTRRLSGRFVFDALRWAGVLSKIKQKC